jgi:hypothetical protein
MGVIHADADLVEGDDAEQDGDEKGNTQYFYEDGRGKHPLQKEGSTGFDGLQHFHKIPKHAFVKVFLLVRLNVKWRDGEMQQWTGVNTEAVMDKPGLAVREPCLYTRSPKPAKPGVSMAPGILIARCAVNLPL